MLAVRGVFFLCVCLLLSIHGASALVSSFHLHLLLDPARKRHWDIVMGSAAAEAAPPAPSLPPLFVRHPQEPPSYAHEGGSGSGSGGGVYYGRSAGPPVDEEDVDPDDRDRIRHLSRRRLSAPEAPTGRGSLGAPEMEVYPHSSGPRYAHPYGSGRDLRQPPGRAEQFYAPPLGEGETAGRDLRQLSPLPSLPPPRPAIGVGGDAYREAYAPLGYGLPTPLGEARDQPLPPLLHPPPAGVQYVVSRRGAESVVGGSSAGGGTVAFVRRGGGDGGGGGGSDAEVADVDRRVGGGGGGVMYQPDYATRGRLPHSSRSDDARPLLEAVDAGDVVGAGGALLGRGGRLASVGGPRGVPSTPAGAAVAAAATAAGRCTECGVTLSPGKSLARHMRLVHGGAGAPSVGGASEGATCRKFTCGQCTQAFKRRYDLLEHTRQVHLKVCFFAATVSRSVRSESQGVAGTSVVVESRHR